MSDVSNGGLVLKVLIDKLIMNDWFTSCMKHEINNVGV